MEYQEVIHPFEPVYDEGSKVLILGSFPSVKSREVQFYYGHPRNRFWKVLSMLTKEKLPQTVEEKRRLLLNHGIGVWDVIAACRIVGSSDSSIRDVKVNDFAAIIRVTPEIRFFANGAKAYELYQRYAFGQTGKIIRKLPSTSPANAAWSVEKLCLEWGEQLNGIIH